MSPDRAARGNNTRHTGFTLIELLVVVFIIGILISLTLVIIPKVKRAVYTAQTQAQLSALSNAIQQYYNDYKSYPGPLANNQLDWSADSVSGNQPNAYSLPLTGFDPPTFPSSYDPPTGSTFGYNITSSQNLVLGLLGGLELQGTPTTGVTLFVYNPQDIFSDGVNLAPRGPASLNFANPRRQNAYIQVKTGDISTPNTSYNGGNGASFADSASRSPNDAMIPVFLDKYSEPLPILYYRTNVGGKAIAGFRSSATIGGPAMTYTDPNTFYQATLTAQYDLLQNYPYVTSKIGLNGNNPNSIHGLVGLGENSGGLTDTIDSNVNGTNVPSNPGSSGGSNGIAYFADPSLNTPTNSNVHLGVARQKDGYILISAGPDRQYGTHDDQVFPGPLQPQQ